MNKTLEKSKKIIASLLIVSMLSLFCFFPAKKAQATVWPAVDPGIQTGLDQIRDMLQGLIVGVLKQQAVNMLNSQVNNLAGKGAGGQPSFVVDYWEEIRTGPKNATAVYMNDFVSIITRGRNTYSGYSSEGFSGPGNYANSLVESNNSGSETPQITMESNMEQAFQNEYAAVKEFQRFTQGINNSWAVKTVLEDKEREIEEAYKDVAMTKVIANQGFVGTPGDVEGTVTSPGILTKEMMANAQSMPNDVLANAESITEVISALVSQLISKAVTQGFSSVQRSISKKSSSVSRATAELGEMIEDDGPEARFGN